MVIQLNPDKNLLYVMQCPECSSQEWMIIVDRPGKPEKVMGLRCVNCEGDLTNDVMDKSFMTSKDKLKELFYDVLNKDIEGLMSLLKELNKEVEKRI